MKSQITRKHIVQSVLKYGSYEVLFGTKEMALKYYKHFQEIANEFHVLFPRPFNNAGWSVRIEKRF